MRGTTGMHHYQDPHSRTRPTGRGRSRSRGPRSRRCLGRMAMLAEAQGSRRARTRARAPGHQATVGLVELVLGITAVRATALAILLVPGVELLIPAVR